MANQDIELIGLPELRKRFGALELEVLPQAAARAANRTAKTVRTRNSRSVAQFMGSRKSDVKRRYKIEQASSRRPVAHIEISGKSLNLVAFKARQVATGVSAAPWARRRIFPTAFITRISGNRLVMVRRKMGGSRVGRLPIRPVRGPGIAKEATRPRMAAEREDIVRTRYPLELESALEFLLRRYRD